VLASLMMISWERHDVTKRVLEKSLSNHGLPQSMVELLVCDQGSTDQRVVPMIEGFRPAYFRRNSGNEGCAHSFNQLYLRSTGEFLVLMGNDIEMPDGWLAKAVKYLELVPNSGLAAIDWGHSGVPPLSTKCGVEAHFLTPTLNRCFGVTVFRRSLIEALGFFEECYGPYGIEDSSWNERVNRAGYNSFYVPGLKSRHLVHDVGERTEYRRMKDESLSRNAAIFSERVRAWDAGASLVEPLPPMREPV